MSPSPLRRLALPLVAALLVGGFPKRCSALYSVEDVSRQRAGELGITVRFQPREHDVWVHVEFKTAGPLKEFKWADLTVNQGDKRVVSAALLPRKPTPDSVELAFYVDPTALPNSQVTLFAHPGLRGGIGYRLKMKEFAASPTRE